MTDATTSLTDVHRTAVLALRLRALDARSPRPILDDPASSSVADSLRLDLDTPRLPRAVVAVHAVWTRMLDDIVRRFVAAHPDAVVIDLGCGFDPRAVRCRPTGGVSWYSVDLPPVAELRRRCVPGPEHVLAADVTAPGWLAAVPGNRPTVVIADGLMPLLDDQDFRAVIRAVTGHAGVGELAFLGYGRLAMRNSRRVRIPALHVPTRAEGIDDPREPEAWGAGLVLREELFRAGPEELRRYPPVTRLLARLGQRGPRIARAGGRVLHYSFEAPDDGS